MSAKFNSRKIPGRSLNPGNAVVQPEQLVKPSLEGCGSNRANGVIHLPAPISNRLPVADSKWLRGENLAFLTLNAVGVVMVGLAVVSATRFAAGPTQPDAARSLSGLATLHQGQTVSNAAVLATEQSAGMVRTQSPKS